MKGEQPVLENILVKGNRLWQTDESSEGKDINIQNDRSYEAEAVCDISHEENRLA